MVNPVQPAANFFLGWLQVIPTPVKLLMFVAVGFFVIRVIIHLVIK